MVSTTILTVGSHWNEKAFARSNGAVILQGTNKDFAAAILEVFVMQTPTQHLILSSSRSGVDSESCASASTECGTERRPWKQQHEHPREHGVASMRYQAALSDFAIQRDRRRISCIASHPSTFKTFREHLVAVAQDPARRMRQPAGSERRAEIGSDVFLGEPIACQAF